jgi:hypothetical protein
MQNDRHHIGKLAEIAWPSVFATAAAIVGLCLDKRLTLPLDVQARLLDKLVDFCSIGVGFWATALALLLALEGRETVEGLKTLKIYGRIVSYFLGSVYGFFALLLLCLLTIAVGRPYWLPHRIFIALWGFLLVFTGSSMLRSFRLLGKLLRSK